MYPTDISLHRRSPFAFALPKAEDDAAARQVQLPGFEQSNGRARGHLVAGVSEPRPRGAGF